MRRVMWFGAATAALVTVATFAPQSRRAPGPAADDGARVVRERWHGDRVVDLTVTSPVLPGEQHVRLLLPPAWRRETGRVWPTLWLLHGAREDHTAWTRETDITRIPALHEVIVVMPDGGRWATYADWWDGGANDGPRWETFHLTELRQILERGYRAGPSRAVAGAGEGGLGALGYAARHRGLFRAAASFSGLVHTLHQDPRGLDALDIVQLNAALARPGLDWRRLWGDPHAQRAVWRCHNPYDLVTQLTGVRLYVSAGTGSAGPYDPRPGRSPDIVERLAHTVTRLYADKLRKLGVPASAHFYDGTGTWPYWQRELRAALPLLLADASGSAGETGQIAALDGGGHEVGEHVRRAGERGDAELG